MRSGVHHHLALAVHATVVIPRTSYSRSPVTRPWLLHLVSQPLKLVGVVLGEVLLDERHHRRVRVERAVPLRAPPHQKHARLGTPGSWPYVKLCRLRFTRGFHSRMSSSYARFPRASCTCDVYTTSSSTSDGSTSNNARLSFSKRVGRAELRAQARLLRLGVPRRVGLVVGRGDARETARGTGRERAPVPKPPRERRGRGASGAIARGAAARWGIAGGVLSASGLLKAPRATPGSALRSKHNRQPSLRHGSDPRNTHARRGASPRTRLSPRSAPVRPMRGSY